MGMAEPLPDRSSRARIMRRPRRWRFLTLADACFTGQFSRFIASVMSTP
jgi:hypothetical protein